LHESAQAASALAWNSARLDAAVRGAGAALGAALAGVRPSCAMAAATAMFCVASEGAGGAAPVGGGGSAVGAVSAASARSEAAAAVGGAMAEAGSPGGAVARSAAGCARSASIRGKAVGQRASPAQCR